jgi:hypothetical protein
MLVVPLSCPDHTLRNLADVILRAPMKTLNEPFSKLSMRRRYEVWFQRLGLADGSGAWWFRYLLTNPGRSGCGTDSLRQSVQVWATWFPREGKPETWIQGFALQDCRLSFVFLSIFPGELPKS